MQIDYGQLYEELMAYNQKVNLTAIEGWENFKLKHIDDSKLALPYVKGNVLDIGSGAGFPALVLKNENPNLNITMLETVGKKVTYLNYVIDKFQLQGIRAVHTRIEDFKEKAAFDTVTARALARMNTLAEYALPFVKLGGTFVAYKAKESDEELKEAECAIKLLGGKIKSVLDIPLSEDITRRLVIVEKIAKSPSKYPRGQNKPRTNPICK